LNVIWPAAAAAQW